MTAAALVSSLVCAGCSAASTGQTADNGSDASIPWPDIVQPDDFTGFCKWSSAPATAPGDASDGVHAGVGPLTVYWNMSPPHGSQQFPVGTIVVKESNNADPTMRVVFAMVKRQPRGTGYNSADAGGADGWEWWSLEDEGNCTLSRLWRGPAPPVTEPYAGKTVGDCNGCHSEAVDNDYVWDTALQLSHF
jgi:Cytochrome P460